MVAVRLSFCVEQSVSAESLNVVFHFVVPVILRECTESLNVVFLFAVACHCALAKRHAQNPSMPFSYWRCRFIIEQKLNIHRKGRWANHYI
jgi:hypothetical protein